MTSSESNGKFYLSMGAGTHKVPLELFALNRRRLCERLKSKIAGTSLVFLQGGEEKPLYDTDVAYNEFRQESYFMWAFGVLEPGYYGAIDVETGRSYLFVPHYPESYAVWLGPLHSLADIARKYQIDEAHYVSEIENVLSSLKPTSLLTIKGKNTDSGLEFEAPKFEGIEKFQINTDLLFKEIADLRVYKTEMEIGVMEYVIKVSSDAHRHVMRTTTFDRFEYQSEADFLHYCYNKGGCRHASYTCICASHTNSAILHYGHAAAPNNRLIKSGDLCLFDMGAGYFGYASDITCTFPANGKFTADQRLVYEAVLSAHGAVMKKARPGTSWSDMHLLANYTLLDHLKSGGLLKGDVNAMVTDGLGAVFQPHGLGHLLGLDVHDVGGYLDHNPPRLQAQGLDKLRTARKLEENMVLTIEPGCYFIDKLLDDALSDVLLSHYFVPHVIERFRGFGGVRIEDNVVVTKDGVRCLSDVPRTVEEIEQWMAGKN